MGLKAKLTAAVIAAAMHAPYTAQAEEWIELSSWSYNSVSGFVSDGLLPESFKGISDYKADITRIQFTDLVESVIKKTKAAFVNDTYNYFEDTASGASADFLAAFNVVNGTGTTEETRVYEGGSYKETNKYFSPEEKISREDAAVIIYRAGKKFGSDEWMAAKAADDLFDDKADFADYSYEPVCELKLMGIVTAVENNNFMPESDLTIEQAITMLYRMYGTFIKMIKADYEGIDETAGETILKSFGGINEVYADHTLYIKDNNKVYLTLDADIYSIINFAEYNGKRLAYAVNFNDKTDVYNIDAGEFIYTIPYITESVDAQSGLVYIVSSRFSPTLYGVYDMEGNLKLAPEYSKTELETLVSNGFKIPEQTVRGADGQIYFSNWNDGGALYKVDSNGDNMQKLNSNDCYEIKYYNGFIFYRSRNDDFLHCVAADGKNDRVIGDVPLTLPERITMWFDPDEDNGKSFGINVYSVSLWNNFRHMAVCADNGLILLDEQNRPYSADLSSEEITVTQLSENYTDVFTDGRSFYMFDRGNHALYVTDGGAWKRILEDYDIEHIGFEAYKSENNGEMLFSTTGERDKYYIYNTETGEITENVYSPEDKEEEYGGITEETEEEFHESIRDELSDDEYTIIGRYYSDVTNGGTDTSFFIERNGERSGEIYGRAAARFGDILLYEVTILADREISYGYRDFYEYNIKTGEKKLLTDNYRGEAWLNFRNITLNGNYIYSDWNNIIYRYTPEKGAESVYPCKGLYKYGEPVYIVKPDEVSCRLYKIDKDANFYRLTDVHTRYEIYVKNGEEYAETTDR